MKLRIIILAIIPFIVYLMGAFVSYDWNPGHWQEEGRVFAVILAVAIAFVATMINDLIGDK